MEALAGGLFRMSEIPLYGTRIRPDSGLGSKVRVHIFFKVFPLLSEADYSQALFGSSDPKRPSGAYFISTLEDSSLHNGGLRAFHQKSISHTTSIVRAYVVFIWSRCPPTRDCKTSHFKIDM